MKYLRPILLVAVSFASLLVYNAVTLPRRQITVDPLPADPEKDYNLRTQDELAQRLSEAVQSHSISFEHGTSPETAAALLKIHQNLEAFFPLLHQNLKKELVAKYSLLYTWEGIDVSLKPIMLCGHLDVVPIEKENLWKYEPFSGKIADGYVWGRGTMDDKTQIMAIMETVEDFLKKGYKPKRTVYLAFGHDEEVSGFEGAANIAAILTTRGVQMEFILDEGLLIISDIIPGVKAPLAVVGVSEKGYATMEVRAETGGGHSSMPPFESSIGIVAEAIRKIESNPPPIFMDYIKNTLQFIASELSFPNRIALSNFWIFEPFIRNVYTSDRVRRAQVLTTTAVTMIHGGTKQNVLPMVANATVNFRIIPSESVHGVLERIRATVNDPRVQISIKHNVHGNLEAVEPAPVTSHNTPQFELFHKTIKQICPDVFVAPGLMIANTDTRHYWGLSRNIYRFQPIRANPEDLARIHGIDERISISNYVEIIKFYNALIRNFDGPL